MQTGRLYETKYGRTRTREMNTWIIGSCNSISKFSRKLLSRFLCIKFKEYEYRQFLEICKVILQKKDLSLELAGKIANLVWNELGSKDVRDVMKLSLLVKNENDFNWIREVYPKLYL